MNGLAAQQGALLRALSLPTADAAAQLLRPHLAQAGGRALRGLQAYRAHALLLAERALRAAYPRVAECLAETDFAGLARTHWQRHPPAHGDLARWGARLAGHIESMAPLVADHPGLADLARIDWALHRAATAADAAPRLASLQWLANAEPGRVTLRLAPATACVAGVLVWRRGFEPVSRPLAAGEAGFIAALRARLPLDAALDAAPQLEFRSWLAQAVQEQLVLGARRLRPTETPP